MRDKVPCSGSKRVVWTSSVDLQHGHGQPQQKDGSNSSQEMEERKNVFVRISHSNRAIRRGEIKLDLQVGPEA